jgi:hypothetical protein
MSEVTSRAAATAPTMGDEFIVFDTEMGRYVSDVDTYDGDTGHAPDPRQARIFRGATWAEFWARPRYRAVAFDPRPGPPYVPSEEDLRAWSAVVADIEARRTPPDERPVKVRASRRRPIG